jgi:hypothetical protein
MATLWCRLSNEEFKMARATRKAIEGKDVLLDKTAYAKFANAPMLDLYQGGMHGWSPDLTQWISNQAYVRQHLVCILLEAPKFFDYLPASEKWYEALKAMFELHCTSIDGYAMGLEVEFEEHAVGGAGEMQEEVVNVKRARSVPKFTFVEKYGMPIQMLLHFWITYGMMDPDAKYAMVNTLRANNGDEPKDLLADWYTASVLAFEPDPTHNHVLKAWISTNMMPKGTGEMVGKRNLTENKEILNLDVEFTALSQTGAGVMAFAENILKAINIKNANPFLRPAFIKYGTAEQPEREATVQKTNDGYPDNTDKLAREARPTDVGGKG